MGVNRQELEGSGGMSYENKTIQRMPPQCNPAGDKSVLRNEDSRAWH